MPIEVKAGGNVRANSLSQMLKENPELKAVRYSMLPYKEQGQMTNVPLYAATVTMDPIGRTAPSRETA